MRPFSQTQTASLKFQWMLETWELHSGEPAPLDVSLHARFLVLDGKATVVIRKIYNCKRFTTILIQLI